MIEKLQRPAGPDLVGDSRFHDLESMNRIGPVLEDDLELDGSRELRGKIRSILEEA